MSVVNCPLSVCHCHLCLCPSLSVVTESVWKVASLCCCRACVLLVPRCLSWPSLATRVSGFSHCVCCLAFVSVSSPGVRVDRRLPPHLWVAFPSVLCLCFCVSFVVNVMLITVGFWKVCRRLIELVCQQIKLVNFCTVTLKLVDVPWEVENRTHLLSPVGSSKIWFLKNLFEL